MRLGRGEWRSCVCPRAPTAGLPDREGLRGAFTVGARAALGSVLNKMSLCSSGLCSASVWTVPLS